MSKILIGCECSGIVRDAFRALGHDAWSCDLKPCEKKSKYHIQDDVRRVAMDSWDMGIFHPVCKRLANSGVRWLSSKTPRAGYVWNEREQIYLNSDPAMWEALDKGAEFFNFFLNLDHIPKTVTENPIQHKYARLKIQKYSQIIQPTDFGHTTRKATCLWLKGLEPLRPTWRIPKEFWTSEVRDEPPGPEREANRSRTFQGIAIALADQYGRQPKRMTQLKLIA
jgi:hypothetical protein